MIIILSVTWLLISIGAIYIDDKWYRWKYLFRIFAGFTILSFILTAGAIYNPNLNHMIGGVIEINPTWDMALLIAIAGGICLTGPVSIIHILYKKYKRRG